MKANLIHLLFPCALLGGAWGCMTGDNDFFARTTLIRSTAIPVNGLLGRPSEIVCAGDNLLYCDRYEGQAASILNIHDTTFFRRALYIGEGPGEVVTPLKLSVSDTDKIGAFQAQNGRMYTYDLQTLLDTTTAPLPEAVARFEDRPANVKKTAEGFVGIGMYDDGRYRLYGKEG
jgi:hypothetical protein